VGALGGRQGLPELHGRRRRAGAHVDSVRAAVDDARVTTVEELPVGTVSFLFTDIEGSTQLLKRLGGERYSQALADHQRILRELFAEHGGHEIDTQGDSFFVAFRRAKDAVTTAVAAQRRLAEFDWPGGSELRVRMGIHTGEPAVGGERYVGLGVHRAARICSAGHGGQVLVSQTTRELLRDDPIPEVSLRDLGEHQLKDMDEAERLYQVVAPGLGEEFPALKTAATTPFEGREGELAEAAAETMARSWRRPGRRVLIGATFAAALVGAVLGVLLTRGGGSTAEASVSANAVGVIDPDGGSIAAQIPVGVAPGGVAFGEGAIWVTNTGANSVSRIDPETNDVEQTISVGGGPSGIATGGGAVWVANGLEGTVTRIDAETNLPSQKVTVGNGPTGVAHGQGAVWVTNSGDGTVTRIDPSSGRGGKAFPAIVGAAGIAFGHARLWVVSPATGKVAVLDPRGQRVVKEISVGNEPAAVAAGRDAVWVANRADGTVSKIDPETLTVTDLVQVGRGPSAVAAGPEDVWVANESDGTVSRFDPGQTSEPETTALVNPPRGLALAPGGVYVAVGSRGTEHRGGELKVVTGTVDSVDPAFAYQEDSWGLLTIPNDGLVGFRRVGGVQGVQLVPDLAVSLPAPTNGGTVYTFEVRKGVRYSNGRLVQPEDFRQALERLFELGSPGAAYYAGIVGAGACTKGKPCDLSRGVVADRASHTVSVRLTEPDGDFLTKLALPFAFAVPAGTPKRVTAANPVPATGPYRFAGYDEKTKTYRLVRNARFRQWSADAQPSGFPHVITVNERGFAQTPRIRAVLRGLGDITLYGGLPLSKEELDQLFARYPSRLRFNTRFHTDWFFLNTRVAPFDNVQVRRAVNQAFDSETYVELLGREHAPTCQILPPNLPGYRRICPYATGGVDRLGRARRLVAEAGVAGTHVTVWAPEPAAIRARYVASVLELLDLRADVRTMPVDPKTRLMPYFHQVSDSRNKVQIGYDGGLADYPSAAVFIPRAVSCDAFIPASPLNGNLAQFCDPAIDAKMTRATALQAQDPPAATLMWQEVERDLLAQAPLLPTDNRRAINFLSERVGNYQYNPQWGVLLSQLWVK
jgi:peptide/nickel transport system substrate-binding protein